MKCEIIACDRVIFSSGVSYVYTRTPIGWLGILPGHAPATFALEDAPLRIGTEDGERTFRVKRGFVRVSPEGIAIFVDELQEEHAR